MSTHDELLRSPFTFLGSAGPGATVTETNLTSIPILLTRLIYRLTGVGTDQSTLAINGQIFYGLDLPAAETTLSHSIALGVLVGPGQAFAIASGASLTTDFAVAGEWIANFAS
jgi:hypothetical protein